MEGVLKKKVSILRGFQDRWFVLTEKGSLEYSETDADYKDGRIRRSISVMLANIMNERDEKTFRVISNSGETFILMGKSKEERERWVNAITLKQQECRKHMFVRPLNRARHSTRSDSPMTNVIADIERVLKISHSSSDLVSGNVSQRSTAKLSEPKETKSNTDTLQQQKQDDISIPFKENCLVVAAIDFGSSASGCAFSYRSEYKLDPLKIHSEPIDGKDVVASKAPTAVLLDSERKFVAFGKLAQEIYAELAGEDEHKGFYFFDRFKMQLYTAKSLNKDMTLKDITGKEMKASDVFAICIEYIKDTVFKRAEEAMVGLKEENVHWMLTVPAIWNESARQFMIFAAEKAGINRDLLTLVLEPEAAAIYCKHIQIQKKHKGQQAQLEVFEPGSQFLVVDLGGGTVDITCNEVLVTGQLREVYNASGGPWGGNMINQRIWKLMRKIFTNEVIDKFIEENTESHLDLLKTIENEKMKMSRNKISVLRLPYELCEEKIIKKDGVKIVNGKLHINPPIIIKIFESSTTQVCCHLEKVLKRKETKFVKALLLVGGYSSCEMVKSAIKEKFNQFTIICPLSPEMIVLKGAVIMGHMNCPIVGRLAKYHYGISPSKGLERITKTGQANLLDIHRQYRFHPLITKGQEIVVGNRVIEYGFIVKDENLDQATFDVLISEADDMPTEISDESCTKIGQIEVRLPLLQALTEIKLIVTCQETEFKITAVVENTGQQFSAICSFLN